MSDTTETFHDHTPAGKQTINAAGPANFAKIESGGRKAARMGTEDLIGDERNLDTILGIPVNIQVVLGSATMLVANLLKLGRGAVIPLNHRVGEPVDIVVNGRVVARGEVVVVEDDNSRFGVSLTEIISAQSTTLDA
ncbi:flagellar motor switch protein FliN [Polymorphum gilvum]|uniref:Flagellar motor switch protein FliN n=1 Tax=Polymorphum gilvum (strain LMG 25793 / CGMCC 1.9160 / SL003B-26A1) TaxID=991905 RepID=F2J4M4_POLGS|nr:flagellar motor switch protein FliN [Polymorphum gilvum]ADZ72276.1 Probable flagellar motor switch protein [Polymorphum gilvum SL003B-26A1]